MNGKVRVRHRAGGTDVIGCASDVDWPLCCQIRKARMAALKGAFRATRACLSHRHHRRRNPWVRPPSSAIPRSVSLCSRASCSNTSPLGHKQSKPHPQPATPAEVHATLAAAHGKSITLKSQASNNYVRAEGNGNVDAKGADNADSHFTYAASG